MTKLQFRPTPAGKLFTSTVDWTLVIDGHAYSLTAGAESRRGTALQLENLSIRPGAFWATVEFPAKAGGRIKLDGIPNVEAHRLRTAVLASVVEIRAKQATAAILRKFDLIRPRLVAWARSVIADSKQQLSTRGWLTSEFRVQLLTSKPADFDEVLSSTAVKAQMPSEATDVQDAAKLWTKNLVSFADAINARHLESERQASSEFFQTVEKSPLNEEQIEAVACFDNRVLLVASAGSGKTSTMVAKTGYALHKGYFGPESILLLAFNNDAAAELRQRLKARLEPLGLSVEKVTAKTFHAFGLDVIGAATGKKPSLAPWLDGGKDVESLLMIVDQLKDRDPGFRTRWDMFRVVFGQDLPEFGKEEEAPDSWDRNRGREGFWTLNNETVKSRGEQVLANWLFYNGVNYVYEQPYQHDTADPTHRQYNPDFYFPDIDAYLEHWALDKNGEPPPEFSDYKRSMGWKKKTHAQNGTTLLETTMAQLWSGEAFAYLSTELTRLGITLDPNPDRQALGRSPIENPRLARTFRTFLTHFKSNRLQLKSVRSQLAAGVAGPFRYRHEMFLDLFEPIHQAWQAKLNFDKCIDFEDMLNMAADHIEGGRWSSPFELVMVDEFQDASQARARILKSLVNSPKRCLFAVGDDWQSINRFAGADLSVMTEFEGIFGKAVTLKLEQTFRCPQSLCDISSKFVQRNPRQLKKQVRSTQSDVASPISIVRVPDLKKDTAAAISTRLAELARENSVGNRSVLVLGRYNNDRQYMPKVSGLGNLKVEFLTAHSSKGLEADHVIVPGMTSATLGFPSGVADDPVMLLVMPSGEAFSHAEERRLFYVAMTRARLSVTLVTQEGKESDFIKELIKDHGLTMRSVDGREADAKLCPKCGNGFLTLKKGKFGEFYGCSSYPRCGHTLNIARNSHRTNRWAETRRS